MYRAVCVSPCRIVVSTETPNLSMGPLEGE